MQFTDLIFYNLSIALGISLKSRHLLNPMLKGGRQSCNNFICITS